MAELDIETPDGAERTVALADRAVTMGRADDCDVVLTEQKASRKHCRVEPRAGGWRVVDEGSSNGTWLGGKPVLAARLKAGDAIEIGDTVITFNDAAVEAPPPRRPRPKKKATPWAALFVPVLAAAAAVGLVIKFDESEGAAASSALARVAKAEIERASFEKDAGRRTEILTSARNSVATLRNADAALALLDAAAAPAPTGGAGDAQGKDDWRAALDQVDADKTASPGQRRARLVDLLDRHMDDAAAIAAIRDRVRAELVASGARVRLDREQTFADADKAAEDGRFGVALTLWTSWVQRAPSLTPEDDAAVAQRISDLLTKSRAAAEEAAKAFDVARTEGRTEAAQAALDAATDQLRGTGFDVWLAARGSAVTVRRPGTRAGPEKADDVTTRERTRALQIAAVAEQFARQRRFDDAAAKLDEAAAAVGDAGLKGELAARSGDVRTESAFLTKLLGWVAADPKKFSPLKLGDHLVRIAGATPGDVSIADRDGNPEPHAVADLPASWFTQLVEKAGLDKADFIPAALFLREVFEQDGYTKWMRAALSDDGMRAAASDVHARCINRPNPVGGYMPNPDDAKSIVTYDEWKAIKNAKEIARLRGELTKIVADVEKSKQAKAIESVRRAYVKLEEARNYALALIFDEVKYFYPYRGTGREAEYAKVQHEVDERVKAVRDAWDDKTKVTIRTDAAMETLRAKADKLVTDIAFYGGDPADLVDRMNHVTMYIVKDDYGTHDAPVGRRDGSATHDVPVGKDADVSLGKDLTVQNFFENQKDLDLLIYDARVMKYNPTVKGPADPEREQVRITNEYRMMFGHRRALRIQPKLVNSARGHSEDMAKLGFFDHFNPFNPEKHSPEDRMKLAGYEMAGCSENIYMGGGSPESAHEGWIHSSGHHRNILTPAWVEMGSGNSGSHWTQNFGFQMTDEWTDTPK